MITTSTQVTHPDDRRAIWESMRSAFQNNERAVNHFPVRPVNRVNLATPTRRATGGPSQSVSPTDARQRGTNESQSGGRFLFFCSIALAACGLVAWLALAWILPALLDVVMR